MVPWYICPQKEMLRKPKFKGVKTVKLVLCLQGQPEHRRACLVTCMVKHFQPSNQGEPNVNLLSW